jgi:hypothetical protein
MHYLALENKTKFIYVFHTFDRQGPRLITVRQTTLTAKENWLVSIIKLLLHFYPSNSATIHRMMAKYEKLSLPAKFFKCYHWKNFTWKDSFTSFVTEDNQ